MEPVCADGLSSALLGNTGTVGGLAWYVQVQLQQAFLVPVIKGPSGGLLRPPAPRFFAWCCRHVPCGGRRPRSPAIISACLARAPDRRRHVPRVDRCSQLSAQQIGAPTPTFMGRLSSCKRFAGACGSGWFDGGGASLVEISFPHCCGDVYQTLKCDGRGSLSSRGCAVTDARIFTVVKENANIASYHPLISPQHTKPTCIGDACAMHARPACPSHLMSRRVREIRSHQGLGNDERFHPQDATPRPLHPIRLPLALRLSS